MRREHIISESYIDWLKSLGCLVYIPFTEDMQDKISGISCVPTGDGAYSFVDGYCQIALPSAAVKTVLNITLPDLHNQVNKSYSLLAEVQCVQKSVANNSCRPSLFSNQAINSEVAPQCYGNCCWSSIPLDMSLYKTARVYDYSAQKTTGYYNGAYYNQATNQNIDITSMSSPLKDGFTFGCAGHNNFRNCIFKIRNFMMFDRALTLSEVRQIQGY